MNMKKNPNPLAALLLAVVLLLLAVVLLLRFRNAPEAPDAESDAPTQSDARPFTIEAPPTPSPTPTPPGAPYEAQGYTAETYQLVSDLVYTRRQKGEAGDAEIETLLDSLTENDKPLGEAWRGIMDTWSYVNRDMEVQCGQVPQGLPEDDSLCIVVLGFQLQYDGTMAPQLIGRCETALACARRYPNALLALTGGGTAMGDAAKTEAGVMADWFALKGIRSERIIVEDQSLTTDQNARNTTAILTRDYPQVRTLLIVTSDYHMPLGVLMFTESALLHGYETGTVPFTVQAHSAFATNATEGDWSYWGEKNQGSYVWALAAPKIQ